MKIGVVGMGSIGSKHASNIAALGHKAVCYDPMIRKDVKFEHNIYEECDAVVIATPTVSHLGCLRAAVERGRHILIEKPIAHGYPDQVRELLDRADASNCVVMVGTNLRFHPCIGAAKDWISKGHIGHPMWAKFISASQVSKKTYRDDGVILNTGAHEVDYALHLLGPASVASAWAHVAEDGTDDMAEFVLIHDSGCVSSFSLNYITKNEIREAWIVGSEKNIGLDILGRRLSFGTMVQGYPGTYFNDYLDEMQAFIDRIGGKETKGASGREGLAALEILLEVKRLARMSIDEKMMATYPSLKVTP